MHLFMMINFRLAQDGTMLCSKSKLAVVIKMKMRMGL